MPRPPSHSCSERKKVQKVRIIAYIPAETFHHLCAESEASGRSRSEIVERALERRPLLEEIRSIIREELAGNR
jgi:hypothetical protein